MKNNEGGIEVSSKYTLPGLKVEDALIVPNSDMNYLEKKVKRIKSKTPIFLNISLCLFSIAITSFIALLTKSIIEDARTICWIITATTSMGSVLSFIFFFMRRHETETSKTDILEEIDRIRKKQVNRNEGKY